MAHLSQPGAAGSLSQTPGPKKRTTPSLPVLSTHAVCKAGASLTTLVAVSVFCSFCESLVYHTHVFEWRLDILNTYSLWLFHHQVEGGRWQEQLVVFTPRASGLDRPRAAETWKSRDYRFVWVTSLLSSQDTCKNTCSNNRAGSGQWRLCTSLDPNHGVICLTARMQSTALAEDWLIQDVFMFRKRLL